MYQKNETMNVNIEPFLDLLLEHTPWKWTPDHERLFQKLKTGLTSEIELTILNTKHPPFYHSWRFSKWIRRCYFLTQWRKPNESYFLYFSNSTIARELLGIVHALQINEFLIVGSSHPIYVFSVHKLLLHSNSTWQPNSTIILCTNAGYQSSPNSKLFAHLEKIDLLQTCSAALSQQLTHKSINFNRNNFPQIDLAILQNNPSKPVYYLIEDEER